MHIGLTVFLNFVSKLSETKMETFGGTPVEKHCSKGLYINDDTFLEPKPQAHVSSRSVF